MKLNKIITSQRDPASARYHLFTTNLHAIIIMYSIWHLRVWVGTSSMFHCLHNVTWSKLQVLPYVSSLKAGGLRSYIQPHQRQDCYHSSPMMHREVHTFVVHISFLKQILVSCLCFYDFIQLWKWRQTALWTDLMLNFLTLP